VSSRYNRFLKGWLGLLDAKVGGFTPTSSEDNLRPTLDTYPFFFSQVRELVTGGTGTISGAAEGFNPVATLLVPDNEVWFVHNATVTGTILAGDSGFVVPAVQIRSRSLGILKDIVLGQCQPMPTPVGSHQACGFQTAPYYAQPGDQFGIFALHLNFAVAVEFVLSMLIARAQV
jgi:hypothetical protein